MAKVSEAHLEARRQQILDAAIACFARAGFHQTTMADIAREAGLGTGLAYRYFSSKNEIIKQMNLEQSRQVQPTGRMLAGVAVSAGQCTGPVRVIMHEGEFHKLQPGDVLVCPATSPVWSVLFPSIGALLTDTGGMLSHPAIIAREYCIPAVVALGNATELLKDGQIVAVEGTARTVTVV